VFRIYSTIAIIVSCAFSILAGSPKIEFDKTAFECGTIIDGSKDKLQALFIVKNIGDAPLKIESVRPGCGCTVVKFDTLVMPGKTSKIEATVNLANYHTGSISKPVTVTSNATNTPTVQLAINATIQPVIDVSEQFVNFDIAKAGTTHAIFLSSAKKDLKISKVVFRQNKNQNEIWKEQIPISIKYSLSALDSVRADGYRVFKLDLTVPPVTEELRGVLAITTNHPDKQEITLQCVINR
jgi:hypothetical protein